MPAVCRIGDLGVEKPALIDHENNYRDLSLVIKDFDPLTLNFETLEKLKSLDLKELPTLDKNSRIGACVSNPSKFIGNNTYLFSDQYNPAISIWYFKGNGRFATRVNHCGPPEFAGTYCFMDFF